MAKPQYDYAKYIGKQNQGAPEEEGSQDAQEQESGFDPMSVIAPLGALGIAGAGAYYALNKGKEAPPIPPGTPPVAPPQPQGESALWKEWGPQHGFSSGMAEQKYDAQMAPVQRSADAINFGLAAAIPAASYATRSAAKPLLSKLNVITGNKPTPPPFPGAPGQQPPIPASATPGWAQKTFPTLFKNYSAIKGGTSKLLGQGAALVNKVPGVPTVAGIASPVGRFAIKRGLPMLGGYMFAKETQDDLLGSMGVDPNSATGEALKIPYMAANTAASLHPYALTGQMGTSGLLSGQRWMNSAKLSKELENVAAQDVKTQGAFSKKLLGNDPRFVTGSGDMTPWGQYLRNKYYLGGMDPEQYQQLAAQSDTAK